MPRIIFVNRFFAPDTSATSQIASDLAFDLAARGLEVVAITGRQRYDDPNARLPRSESLQGVRILRVWSTRFGRGWLPGRALDYLTFYLSASRALWREASAGSRVIAMTDPPLISLPAAFIARRRGAFLINWLQDVFPEVAERLGVMRQGPVLRTLTSLRNRSLRRAAVNVAIGQRMAERVASDCGSSPVRVIPNWALEEPGVFAGDNPLRRDWQLEDKFVVGYSGNMGRAHALDSLLDVALRLRHLPRIVFLLIGDGAQLPALKARAAALALSSVLFKPYQPRENLRYSLSLPDLHVVSLDERLEGLIVPSKFVGILAMGRPVLFLGAADGEVGGCIARSGCGVVAPSSDAAAIASAIEDLASNPSRLAALAASARAVWDSEFRRAHALDAWADLLTHVHAG